MWNGGQASQAAWLNACLKRHENDYDYGQLNESGTVLTDKGGKVAVFTPEHGHDHASGANRGTTRAPNMRMRESLARFHTLPGTPSPPMTHGGYPTPSSVPPDTSGVKPPTMLQNALGELAESYRVAPEAIEKKDLEYLNEFIERIDNMRLRELWRKKSDKSGRKFVVTMLAEIERSGSSLTAEETMDTRMRLILTNGLREATFNGFLDVVGDYEELNEVRSNPIPEKQRAYAYKKLVCDLSKDIEMKMLLRLSILESAAAAVGNFPARDTPIEHITEAAGIVLDDEMNAELVKSIESGRAFSAGKFDPARNQRNTSTAGTNAGGQTWTYNGPETHLDGMRNCVFCDKPHVDLKCPTATKAQKDALQKERSDKAKAKREAWRERSKKGRSASGSAALARPSPPASSAADDADEAAAKLLFSGSPALLDLDELLPQGGTGHSFMAKPSPLSAPSHSRASQPESSKVPSEAGGNKDDAIHGSIFVVAPIGDTLPDSISVGIYVGDWKSQVLPEIVRLHNLDQLPLDKSGLKQRTTRMKSFDTALARCKLLDIEPIYLGPTVLEGLGVGDDLADYLGETETMSEPSSESGEDRTGTTDDSDPDSDDSEAELDGLLSKVDAFTVNTHVDVLRKCIKDDNLTIDGVPVSPGTGGAIARRTKFQMLQDIRKSVGFSPLDDAALQSKNKKPDVPMGEPVARACEVVTKADLPSDVSHIRDAGKYDLYIDDEGQTYAVEKVSKNAAKKAAKRAAVMRNINFASPERQGPPARPVSTGMSPSAGIIVVVVMQLILIALSFVASGSSVISCRTVSPSWVCDSLGYADTPLQFGAPASSPTIGVAADSSKRSNIFEPGARTSSYVDTPWWCHRRDPHDTPCGGVGLWALFLPVMACLLLSLKSLGTTARFAAARTPRIFSARQANGLGEAGNLLPPRATSRSVAKLARRGKSPSTSSSRFVSTLGEAPIWISLILLAHEITTRVLPFLLAIWCACTLVSTTRFAHRSLRTVFRSRLFTPGRVALRIAANIIAALIYIACHAVVGAFVSEARLRFPRVAVTVYEAAQTLARVTYADLSRWGGAIFETVFNAFSTEIPTETDPSVVDYTENETSDPVSEAVSRSVRRKPRALHAFNPKLGKTRRTQLEGRALLGGPGGLRIKRRTAAVQPGITKDALENMICWTVIDSGCSWHCHPHFEDLINTRKCDDTMSGIDGKPQRVKCIGDLPALARDHGGTWRRILIRNVRCVPSFTDTLLSVDQFWLTLGLLDAPACEA